MVVSVQHRTKQNPPSRPEGGLKRSADGSALAIEAHCTRQAAALATVEAGVEGFVLAAFVGAAFLAHFGHRQAARGRFVTGLNLHHGNLALEAFSRRMRRD
jgi:hypothetical protein